MYDQFIALFYRKQWTIIWRTAKLANSGLREPWTCYWNACLCAYDMSYIVFWKIKSRAFNLFRDDLPIYKKQILTKIIFKHVSFYENMYVTSTETSTKYKQLIIAELYNSMINQSNMAIKTTISCVLKKYTIFTAVSNKAEFCLFTAFLCFLFSCHIIITISNSKYYIYS